MNAPVQPLQHHDTFSRFQRPVRGQVSGKDLKGFVAYCLYKQDKIRWIELRERRDGSRPSRSDIEDQYILMLTDERVEEFRDQAEQIINEFANKMLGAELEAAKTAMQSDATLETVRVELKESGGFWRGVWQNILAGVVTSLLAFVGVGLLWAYTSAPQNFLQNLVMKAMSQQVTVTGGSPSESKP